MLIRLVIILALVATACAQDVPVPPPVTPEQQGTASERGARIHRDGGIEAVMSAQQEQLLLILGSSVGILLVVMLGSFVALQRASRLSAEKREAAAAAEIAALHRQQAVRESEARQSRAELQRERQAHEERMATRYEAMLMRSLEGDAATGQAIAQLSGALDRQSLAIDKLTAGQDAQRLVLLELVEHLPDHRRERASQRIEIQPTEGS